MTRPFLPSDLPKVDPLREWRRAVLAKALANNYYNSLSAATEILFPNDEALQARVLQRAMALPASLTDWGKPLAGAAAGEFIRSLRPRSAAARLFAAGNQATLEGASIASFPRMAGNYPVPAFVGEGGAIPVVQGAFANVTLGPPKKMAFISAMTNEVRRQSADTADTTIRLAMDDAAARGLDAAVLSTDPATDIRPAGLLNGVTPLAATAGGGVPALVGDTKKLVGAIVDAGGGTDIALYMNPQQAIAMSVYAGSFAYPIVPAPSLAIGTVIAIEQAAIVSAFPTLPNVDVSGDVVLHFEDSAPKQIVAAGTVASPGRVQSAFQSDLLAVRMILPCAWASLLPGAVQVINNATW